MLPICLPFKVSKQPVRRLATCTPTLFASLVPRRVDIVVDVLALRMFDDVRSGRLYINSLASLLSGRYISRYTAGDFVFVPTTCFRSEVRTDFVFSRSRIHRFIQLNKVK